MSEEHYVALKPLRFGRQELQPGDPVPVEPGRDYRLMQRLGQIGPAHAGAAATPQDLSTPEPTQGQRVVFVSADGAYSFATFLTRTRASEEDAEALEVPVGAAVAGVKFEDDPNPVVVRLDSLLPEQPTQRLIDDLTGSPDDEPAATPEPLPLGYPVLWVNADGAHHVVTFEGLEPERQPDLASGPVILLARVRNETLGVQHVPLLDLLPGEAAQRLLAFERRMAEEGALEGSQGGAAPDEAQARLAFLELLLQAIRTPGEAIPDDFPAAEFLAQNGLTTLEGVRLLADGEQGRDNLMALDAIGQGRADKILAELAAPADPPASEG